MRLVRTLSVAILLVLANLGFASETITVAEFLNKTEGDTFYQLQGEITDLYNTEYGNFTLRDATGEVKCYGLTQTQVSKNDKSFSNIGVGEGDVIILKGKRHSYNGTDQIYGSYFVQKVSDGGGNEGGGGNDGGGTANPDILPYYKDAVGKSGNNLLYEMRDIISSGVHSLSYDDMWDTCEEGNEDPNNSRNVILLYSGYSVSKNDHVSGNSGWNREHCWPQSKGGNKTDAHHVMPDDVKSNGTRGNDPYGEGGSYVSSSYGMTTSKSTGSKFEPRDEVKGDVARMMMYVICRYSDKSFGSVISKDLALKWHRNDPVDNFERNRNEVIYDYQRNRNPFIDNPELVEYLWGNKTGFAWGIDTSIPDVEVSETQVVNTWVSNGRLIVKSNHTAEVHYVINNLAGQTLGTGDFVGGAEVNVANLKNGIYMLVTVSGEKKKVNKFVVL